MWGNQKKPETISVPKLEPKDLYDRRIRKDYARLRSYNTLLEQIYHRVYATSQLSGNTSSVLYTVPPFILGLPKLDMEDCIVYLVWQLRQTGYFVRFTWPNMLYISWKHHEGDYLANQNPIVQAMIPEPPPAPPTAPKTTGKKKAGAPLPKPLPPSGPVVSFNQEIDIINGAPVPSAFGAQPINPVPRKATDYQPPDSFLTNLDRPGPGRMQSGPKEGAKGNVLADLWTI
jgi:hypothetical protein